MKGKIMAQRILIATCFVMVAVCFVMVGFVWSQSSHWTQANLGLINQAQRTNQEILKQLEAMARSSHEPAKADEWIPVSFQLVVEKIDGPPAVGFSVKLRHGSGGTQKDGAIHRISDANGQADFGVIQPGDWEYLIQAGRWQATGSLNAMPGTAEQKQIICPKSPPDLAPVRIRVAWPAELAGKGLRALVGFQHTGITYEEPLHWSLSGSVGVLCGPKGEMAVTTDYPDSIRFWRFTRKSEQGNNPLVFHQRQGQTTLAADRLYADLGPILDMTETSPIEVDAGTYTIAHLIVLRPGGPQQKDDHRLRDDSDLDAEPFEVVGLFDTTGQGLMVHVVQDMPDGTRTSFKQVFLRGLGSTRSAHRIPDRFEASAGKTAEWTIPLSDQLVKMIDRKLKAHG